jgi:hypothetical protein
MRAPSFFVCADPVANVLERIATKVKIVVDDVTGRLSQSHPHLLGFMLDP